MKKHDFIRELTAQLAPIDTKARAEIIADINEHFTEGLAQGQTEEEICKKLGQPGQIAEQVLEEYKAYKSQGHFHYSAGVNDIEDIVSSAMDSVDIGGIISSALQTAAEATRAASDAIAEANSVKDARIIGWEFGENTNAPWKETFPVETEGATRVRGGYEIDIDKTLPGIYGIDVSLSQANVKFVPAVQSGDIRVTIQGRSRYNTFEVGNKNGILFIRRREPFFKFEIFSFKSKLDVTVYVPASFTGDIKATSIAGNIYASGICGNLKLNTTAGNVTIDGHKADKAHLRTSAGSVSLTNCFINDINAKSSAGNVRLESREVRDLVLGSSAGELLVYVDTLGGNTQLSSSAGSVYLKAHEVRGNINASSSAGSVDIRLPIDVNCRINVSKPSIGSLSNKLIGNPHSPYTLRASTSVGSISLAPIS